MWIDKKLEELSFVLKKIIGQFSQKLVNKLLVPVFSADGGMHWTLLVLERDGVRVGGCRYYDSLTMEHKGCKYTAEMWRYMLSYCWRRMHGEAAEFVEEVPKRGNLARQHIGSNRCGWDVLYYVELELRNSLKQFGVLPWPSWAFVKDKLLDRVNQYRSFLLKWKDLPERYAQKAEKLAKEREEKEEAQVAVNEKVIAGGVLLQRLRELEKAKHGKIVYPKYGCYKCSNKGSTCCDPQKLKAKLHAQAKFAGVEVSTPEYYALPENTKYDKKVYAELKEQYMAEHLEQVAKYEAKLGQEKFEAWEASLAKSVEVHGKAVADAEKKATTAGGSWLEDP